MNPKFSLNHRLPNSGPHFRNNQQVQFYVLVYRIKQFRTFNPIQSLTHSQARQKKKMECMISVCKKENVRHWRMNIHLVEVEFVFQLQTLFC